MAKYNIYYLAIQISKKKQQVLAVVRLSAPATTVTHSRVIRLRRVLTDHSPSGSSIDPASVAV